MELIQVADTVAREKNIDREIVIHAMEEAIQKAGRSKYGHDHDIRAQIDRANGEIKLKRYREVVANDDEIENEVAQLTVDQAKRIKPDAAVGDFLIDELPPLDFGRIAAQTAKQVIMQKVREAERDRQYEEFKDRVGEIINGVVKRVEYGNATIDIQGRAEGLLRRDETIPREPIKNGDRIRAVIYDVRQETRGPQIFLSRSHPIFMAKLFMQEVPEIYDGVIEIKAVARDPGSRAKIAVLSHDNSIDPVGACVGTDASGFAAAGEPHKHEELSSAYTERDIAQSNDATRLIQDLLFGSQFEVGLQNIFGFGPENLPQTFDFQANFITRGTLLPVFQSYSPETCNTASRDRHPCCLSFPCHPRVKNLPLMALWNEIFLSC